MPRCSLLAPNSGKFFDPSRKEILAFTYAWTLMKNRFRDARLFIAYSTTLLAE